MRSGALAVAAMLAWGATRAFAAATLYVGPAGTDSAACGSLASRCKTVQFAIDKTEDGDSVVVGAGTFNECIAVIPGTGVGSITVLSEAIANAQPVGETILDGADVCDAASATPGPVAVVYDLSSLSGFAVKHGGDSAVWGLGAVAITNNIISESVSPTAGGGIFVTTSGYLTDPEAKTLINFNLVRDNTADDAGAGIYLDASADGIPSVVEIRGNKIQNNTAGAAGDVLGAGLTVFTDTASVTDASTVTITTNVIDGNGAPGTPGGMASYGGGVFVATGGGAGAGAETIVLGELGSANAVRNNTARFGGGISANLQPADGAHHTITLTDNNVTANTATLGGGGVHAFAVALDTTQGESTIALLRNSIIGNHATGDPADPLTAGGGGLYAETYMYRVPEGLVSFAIRGNIIRTNDATTLGGGARLLVYADDDPDADGARQPSVAEMIFENNLVAGNSAIDDVSASGSGGGLDVLALSVGDQASVSVLQRFLTVSGNTTDPSGVGGVRWDAQSLPDSIGGGGAISLELSNSILIDNDGFAVGGPIVPGGAVDVRIAYNDTFENVVGDYEPQLGASPGTNGNVEIDPELDPLFVPLLCSPTVDIGDPALDPVLEPLPNGGRVNLGYLGNSINATRTFPDVNGDATIDGLDVLGIAVSFNSSAGGPRFIAAADRDLNGVIDGLDLAYVAAFYAQSCP
jgi:hypothetical protein